MKIFLKYGDDLLNAEGSIIAVYTKGKQFYLAIAIQDGSGKIFLPVSREDLLLYLLSSITLIQLVHRSKHNGVYHKTNNCLKKSIDLVDYQLKLPFPHDLMKDISVQIAHNKSINNIILSILRTN